MCVAMIVRFLWYFDEFVHVTRTWCFSVKCNKGRRAQQLKKSWCYQVLHLLWNKQGSNSKPYLFFHLHCRLRCIAYALFLRITRPFAAHAPVDYFGIDACFVKIVMHDWITLLVNVEC